MARGNCEREKRGKVKEKRERRERERDAFCVVLVVLEGMMMNEPLGQERGLTGL